MAGQLRLIIPEAIPRRAPRSAGIFPLPLAGQPELASAHLRSELSEKLLAVVPTDLLHRVLRTFAAAWVVAHHCLPLFLRHWVLSQVERLRDPHPTLRLLRGAGVVVRIGRPPHELTSRNQKHFQLDALAKVHKQFLRRAFRLADRLLRLCGGCEGQTAECRQNHPCDCRYLPEHGSNLLQRSPVRRTAVAPANDRNHPAPIPPVYKRLSSAVNQASRDEALRPGSGGGKYPVGDELARCAAPTCPTLAWADQ